MPGSGKSTIGRLLSEATEFKLLDTDEYIEKKVGYSINDIFKYRGEKYFRELEKEVLYEIANYDGYIISTGGGLPIYNNNMELLNKLGLTVFLKTSIEELIKRNLSNRPLLKDDRDEVLRNLYKERLPIYSKAALIIDTCNANEVEIVKTIFDKIK